MIKLTINNVLILKIITVLSVLVTPGFSFAIKYEAEDGKLTGTVIEKNLAGYSGSGYVTGFDKAGDEVEITVDAETSIYELYIGYAGPNGEKYNNVYINGSLLGNIQFKASNSFKEILVGKIALTNGQNKIKISHSWGWFYVDFIRIEKSTGLEIKKIPNTLINTNATQETKNLMAYMTDNYSKKILSGQYGLDDAKWIKEQTGKMPAILGLDLIDYSPTRVLYGASSHEIEKAIDWSKSGGIVTFCWHWNAPKDLINQPGKEWWRGFYTDATTFDISKAMNDTTSEGYKLIIRDIDAIAIQLKKLQDSQVPVLWRPLHEAEGAWFWWGAKGAEPCKKLWVLLYNRLTNYHKLNNLIWVWNSIAPDWYPGDGYVDFVSYDSYPPEGDYSPLMNTFEKIFNLVKGNKIIAMSENGAIPDPQKCIDYKAPWSWFATWNGNFIKDGKTNSIDHLKQVFNHEIVITLDELPDLKNYKSSDSIKVTGVEIISKATVIIGKNLKLTATILPADATDKKLSWKSSDTIVAKVNKEGLVTAYTSGTAIITVKTNDGEKTATCQIIVEKKTGIDKANDYNDNLIILKHYPNPNNYYTIISFYLKENSKVDVYLYDSIGQKVMTVKGKFYVKGTNEIELKTNGLKPGTYICILSIEKISRQIKLILN